MTLTHWLLLAAALWLLSSPLWGLVGAAICAGPRHGDRSGSNLSA